MNQGHSIVCNLWIVSGSRDRLACVVSRLCLCVWGEFFSLNNSTKCFNILYNYLHRWVGFWGVYVVCGFSSIIVIFYVIRTGSELMLVSIYQFSRFSPFYLYRLRTILSVYLCINGNILYFSWWSVPIYVFQFELLILLFSAFLSKYYLFRSLCLSS